MNWLKYSNVMIKICSEMDFDSGDSSDGEDGAEGSKLTTRMKKISTSNQAPRRQFSKEQIMAIGAYAQAHGRSFSDFSLETVISDGGIEQ